MTTSSQQKAKSIIVYLIPLLVTNVLPIITLPIVTRCLTPKDFGIAALVMAAGSTIVSFASMNVTTAMQRYYFQYRKNEQQLGQLINTGMIYFGIVLLVTLPVVFAGSKMIAQWILGSAEYGYPLLIAYVASFLLVTANYYLLLYRNMEQAKEFTLYTTIQILLNTAVTLTLIVALKFNYMGLIYGNLVTGLIMTAVLFTRFHARFPISFNKKMLVDNLLFGLQLLPNLFTSSIYSLFDKYLLGNMVSLASTGIYSIAQNISTKVFALMTAVHATFDPIFMKDMFDKGRGGSRLVGRNFTLFTYISLAPVLLAILFGNEIIRLLTPPSYHNVVTVFLVLLCGVATQTYGKVVGSQYAYANKMYVTFPVTVVGLIINVGLNVVLIPRYEALGAAIASMSTTVVQNMIAAYIGQRFYEIKYEYKTIQLLYGHLFVSAAIFIVLQKFALPLALVYSIKALCLALFMIIGMHADIVNKRNMRVLFDIFKLKKQVISGEDPVV